MSSANMFFFREVFRSFCPLRHYTLALSEKPFPNGLSDPTEIPPPLSRDTCRTTPVALCFLWYRSLSLLHTHFFL